MKNLLRMIGLIVCIGVVVVGVGFSLYSYFAPLPEGVRVSRWTIEYYWFFHFWYVWALTFVAVVGIEFFRQSLKK